MWVLRFGNGVTSAGIAVTDDLAQELGLADGEPAWRRFLALYPSIAAQFADAAADARVHLDAAAVVARGTGCRPWVGDVAVSGGFVDPLFSTGIPLTLLGIERLARILEGPRRPIKVRPTSRYAGRHSRGGRPHRAIRCRLLRRVPAVRAVRRLLDVLFRRGQLCRNGQTPARPLRGVALSWIRPCAVCSGDARSVAAIARSMTLAMSPRSLKRSSRSISPGYAIPASATGIGIDVPT